ADRFGPDTHWTRLATGEPWLPDAPTALRCRPLARVPVGDATVVTAEVVGVRSSGREGRPLVHHDRDFHALGPALPAHSCPTPGRGSRVGAARTARTEDHRGWSTRRRWPCRRTDPDRTRAPGTPGPTSGPSTSGRSTTSSSGSSATSRPRSATPWAARAPGARPPAAAPRSSTGSAATSPPRPPGARWTR